MVPTALDGEFVLVDERTSPRIGDVVVANHPHVPAVLVKRVGSVSGDRIELLSDNPSEGTDSRHFGLVEARQVHGVVSLSLSRLVPLSADFPVTCGETADLSDG